MSVELSYEEIAFFEPDCDLSVATVNVGGSWSDWAIAQIYTGNQPSSDPVQLQADYELFQYKMDHGSSRHRSYAGYGHVFL